MAAVERIDQLGGVGGLTSANKLDEGFFVDGVRYPLYNPRRGIFKPKEMRFLLSIKTVFPKHGSRVWYDDQREVHGQIYNGDEYVDYSFMGTNPEAPDNRNLREACENNIPLVYFLGVRPGLYQSIFPVFVASIDAKNLRVRVAFALRDRGTAVPPETSTERRYALREVKQRLHQASFRQALITAYGGRCALSGLPEPMLLDAAHIVPDGHEELGQPIVQNGIPLSKTHHAAFDAHLIGIDPDYGVHVSDRLMSLRDGPVLEALKGLHGGLLRTPLRTGDRPDRDRLAARFDKFRAAA